MVPGGHDGLLLLHLSRRRRRARRLVEIGRRCGLALGVGGRPEPLEALIERGAGLDRALVAGAVGVGEQVVGMVLKMNIFYVTK